MPTSSVIKFACIAGALTNMQQCQAIKDRNAILAQQRKKLEESCEVCNKAVEIIKTGNASLTEEDTQMALSSAEDISKMNNSNIPEPKKHQDAEAKAKDFIAKTKQELGLENVDDKVLEAFGKILRSIQTQTTSKFAGASMAIKKLKDRLVSQRLVQATNIFASLFKKTHRPVQQSLEVGKTRNPVKKSWTTSLLRKGFNAFMRFVGKNKHARKMLKNGPAINRANMHTVVSEDPKTKTPVDVKLIKRGNQIGGYLLQAAASIFIGDLIAKAWAAIFVTIGVSFPPIGVTVAATASAFLACSALLALRKYIKRKQSPEQWQEVQRLLQSQGKEFVKDFGKDAGIVGLAGLANP